MGFSHSWVAVQGVDSGQILAALGMEVREIPKWDSFLEERALIDWRDGWLLVLSDDDEDAFEGSLSRLAKLGPAVACRVNERVMYSEARGYSAGAEVWRVVHDPVEDESLYALDVSGTPPPQLEGIIRDKRAQQDSEGGEEADVDYIFDVPSELAQSICGFSLGEGDPDDIRFSELKKIGEADVPPKSSGFFARLFGRR